MEYTLAALIIDKLYDANILVPEGADPVAYATSLGLLSVTGKLTYVTEGSKV